MSEPLHELEMTAEQNLEALGEGLFDATRFVDEHFLSHGNGVKTVRIQERSPLVNEPSAVPVTIRIANQMRVGSRLFQFGDPLIPIHFLYDNPYRTEIRMLVQSANTTVIAVAATAAELVPDPVSGIAGGYILPVTGPELILNYTGDLWVMGYLGAAGNTRFTWIELSRTPQDA